jgi:hypothetical protein
MKKYLKKLKSLFLKIDFKKLKRLKKLKFKDLNKLKSKKLAFGFLGIILFFLIYSFFETKRVEVNQQQFIHPEVPEEFQDLKIVFLADIHFDFFIDQAKLAEIVALINQQEPDLVLIGGDYVNNKWEQNKPCFEELSKIKATYGIFGVIGNHDMLPALKIMEKNNLQILNNQGVWLERNGQRIKITGVEDTFKGRPDYNLVIQDVKKEDFVIMLSHSPDYAPEVKTDRIDLILSGHTHGGQVTFFGLFAPFTNSKYWQKFNQGFTQIEHTQVFTTTGVGTTFLPLRFFQPPEIVVLTLK